MSLLVTHFPDITAYLGKSWSKLKFQLHPGAPSDYPTGGYPVTASQFELGLLSGVEMCGTNAAGQLYIMTPVFPASSFGATAAPATAINMVVTTAGAQVANNTDLTGLYWLCEVDGW